MEKSPNRIKLNQSILHIIVLRLIILALFFRFRILTPAYDAYPLWPISVISEVWSVFSWILDQFPKWFPITRETYLDRMSIRFEREGEPNKLSPVDVLVSMNAKRLHFATGAMDNVGEENDALSKTLTENELAYLRAQFMLLKPNEDGRVSLDNFKMVSVKN